MNDASHLESRFQALLHVIDEAQAQAAAGRVMDLSALKTDAERLCAEILKAPPEVARNFQPLIGDMISRLDSLEQTLNTLRTQGDS
ncbi:MAG: hypothetical protein LRZ85_03740 [Alphaproteobacteria bacterium]|nr:hypothetical protein [Alphaproteobacteria bacterium]MCD8519815.1 hypothetical protein [Alphaproteobacteria bacterium]MCD8570279.1 hypothetical protein [Alphaproteobacteria bacterium]